MADDSTMKFRADISELRAAMQQASRAIRVANSDFKAATAGMDNWSKSADGLRAKLTQLRSVLTSQKRQLSLAEQELEKTKKVYGENAAETDRAKIKVNQYTASVKKTESELNRYEKELDDVEHGLKDTGNAAKKSGKDAELGAKGFTVMKGALSALVAMGIRAAINGLRNLSREAIEAYKEFDTGADNVIKATGATGKAAEDLEKSYKNVTKSVVGDFGELGNAVGEINTRFGFTGKQLEESSVQFQKFAEITDTDVTNAVRLVSRAMGDAGIESSKYGEVLDELAVAAQASGVSVDTLTENLAKYGAPMRALGFDTKESIALFSQWEKAGVNTQIAFSGMKKAISNWGKANKDPREEFKKTLTDIKNTPSLAQATTKAIEVFGAKAGPDLADAIKNGRFAYEDFLNLIENSGDSVNKTYDQTLDGADKIKLKIQSIRADMGDFVRDIATKYQDQISGFLDSAAKKGKEFITFVVSNSDTILSVLKAIGVALTTTFVVNKIASFVSSIKTLIATFSALKAATIESAVASKALSLAVTAIPFVAVAAATALVAGAFIKYAEEAKKAALKQYELTDAQKKSISASKESKKEYDELNKTRNDAVKNSAAEFQYLDSLRKEYNSLIGTNGKVKKGYEDRASFILTELSNALGIERSEIEKNIGANGKLSDSIAKVIEKKQAEAALSADEEAYKEAIQKRASALQTYQNALKTVDETEAKYNETKGKAEAVQTRYNELMQTNSDAAERYLRSNQAIITANDTAKQSYDKAVKGLGAAEKAYIGYNQTIENHEGLAAAVISGNSKKISESLLKLQNNFVTSKNGTKTVLEEQVKDYTKNYESLKSAVETGMPGVTKSQVKEAKKLVTASKRELAKFEKSAEKTGKKAGKSFASGVGSAKKSASKQGSKVGSSAKAGITSGSSGGKTVGSSLVDFFVKGISAKKGTADKKAKGVGTSAKGNLKSGAGDTSTSGQNFVQGFINGMNSLFNAALSKAFNLGSQSKQSLDKGAGNKSPSKKAKQSGKWFVQGYINGIDALAAQSNRSAYNIGTGAVNAINDAQESQSPSKLTYNSGVNFVKGYINGISGMQKSLVSTVTGLVTNVVAILGNMSNFNFDVVGKNASEYFSNVISKRIDYITKKATYQNEAKLNNFDSTIKSLESARDKKTSALQKASDKRIAALEKKKEKAKSKSAKKKIQNQIKKEKEQTKNEIKAVEDNYKKLISTQEKYKDAYQTASSEMLSELSTALSEYQAKAQALIDETINGITEKYNQRYNDLIDKQNTLIDKLKSAGDLFEISGAGVISINDIKAQTKAITDYTDKLYQIKQKVSAELFDQIASYDMDQGSAFIDQLLSMNAADLDAYNKAYTEKLQAAKKAGESIYKGDFDKVAADYKAEINTAFNTLPGQLEELGKESMKGFVNGLVGNTDFMSNSIKIFVKSIVDTFKKDLGIHSPSKVMAEIGKYTGDGLNEGLLTVIGKIQKTAGRIADSVASPINLAVDDLNKIKSNVNRGIIGGDTNVVNNYNLVQNNTSPKPLSALETYQARRRQIAMVKALTS